MGHFSEKFDAAVANPVVMVSPSAAGAKALRQATGGSTRRAECRRPAPIRLEAPGRPQSMLSRVWLTTWREVPAVTAAIRMTWPMTAR